MDVVRLLKQCGVIPVIQVQRQADAAPLAEALAKGGLQSAEITFRTEAAPGVIAEIAKRNQDFFVCAGTVLTVEQAKIAVENGAKAIISPGMNKDVVRHCLKQEIPVFPGCVTPTEIQAAMELGLRVLKLFPAEVVGGVSLLKALYGPFADVQFMPTGGVNLENLQNYLLQPNVIACGGTWIASAGLLAAGDFTQIEANAAAAAKLVSLCHEGSVS